MSNKKRVWMRVTLFLFLFAYLLCISSCNKDTSNDLDYLNDDLTPYVSIPASSYVGKAIDVHVDEVTDLDVDNAVLQTQAAYKNSTPENDGAYLLDRVMSPGDVVYLYYTPYMLDESGNRIDCYNSSTSNFAASTGSSPVSKSPDTLELGSGSFAAGFELGLVGKNRTDYAKFDYADRGSIREDDTLFITYTAFRTTDSETYEENVTACIRPDDGNIESLYGVGFWDTVTSYQIGSTKNNVRLSLPGEGDESILYSSIKVDFVLHKSSLPVLTVETHFPSDYEYDLFAGNTVYFEVYVQKCVGYTAPEITEDFVYQTVGIAESDLSSYSGDIAERYRAYLRNALEEDRRDDALTLAETEMWNLLKAAAEIKEYPAAEVKRINKWNTDLLEEYYQQYSTMYASFDEFCLAYFDLDDGADWEAYMTEQTKTEIQERLILYTVMREQNIIPTDEEYQSTYQEVTEDLFSLYAEDWGIVRSAYTSDEDYEKAKANAIAELKDYYSEEYFVESTYYQYAGYRILSLFTVTLDGEALNIPIE